MSPSWTERNKDINLVKVQWRFHKGQEATSETEYEMRANVCGELPSSSSSSLFSAFIISSSLFLQHSSPLSFHQHQVFLGFHIDLLESGNPEHQFGLPNQLLESAFGPIPPYSAFVNCPTIGL
ncbi:hypothetical protein OSB04_un000333 [Centaurea solstitialis]|uniref:Uncharacterized protein n=1 Tax=Centaurea solstitialis TaxID=347529 RepID=A0AA38W610_9ASTR|nr:hypothetical protein OSB04_un000333 [Centaurea solstitialis]